MASFSSSGPSPPSRRMSSVVNDTPIEPGTWRSSVALPLMMAPLGASSVTANWY